VPILRRLLSLYSTLETALTLHGKSTHFPKCRFAIADEEIGFYYLDPTTIRTVVGLFKADQSDFFSPVKLSIWLITSPFPFSKIRLAGVLSAGLPSDYSSI
jgi:hypothetical protein